MSSNVPAVQAHPDTTAPLRSAYWAATWAEISARRQNELLGDGERRGVGSRPGMTPGDEHPSHIRQPDRHHERDQHDRGHDDRHRSSLPIHANSWRFVAVTSIRTDDPNSQPISGTRIGSS